MGHADEKPLGGLADLNRMPGRLQCSNNQLRSEGTADFVAMPNVFRARRLLAGTLPGQKGLVSLFPPVSSLFFSVLSWFWRNQLSP